MPLDPEIAAYLESLKRSLQISGPPSTTVEAARTRMRQSAVLTGSAPVLAAVEDFVIQDGLPARQYWPVRTPELPLILYFHGGRFISGDLESHDPLCRLLAQAAHCRVIAVDYRLSPEHPFPGAAEDAISALDWALRQGVPTVVMGDSAGANLAAVAAQQHCRSERLLAQVLIYPMLDPTCSSHSHREFAVGFGPTSEDMQRGWSEYLQAQTDARDVRASPLLAEDLKGLPPALVITAEYDPLCDEGEVYARNLSNAGVPVRLHRYPGAIHGFFVMQGILVLARAALQEVVSFINASVVRG